MAVTEPWPRNAAAMPASSADAGAWRDLAAGARGVGPASRRRHPRRGADDRRELRACHGDRRQQPPALADDLADRPGADGGQLAPQVLGDRGEVAHDVVGRAGELRPQVLALGRDARSGQVSRWHWRAMSQPMATSAAVPNANSSAPRSAATSRSRPVWSPPSVRSATRSRRSLRSRTWWTSASPSSHGAPTCLID